MGTSLTFQVKYFVKGHGCGWQDRNNKLTTTWLAENYMDMFRDDPQWKLTAFQNAIRRDKKIEISYATPCRARMIVMIKLYGNHEQQYRRVRDYANEINKWNDGSSAIVSITPQPNPIFQRMYVCLDACKEGFRRGCRPVLGMDGCHLKGLYSRQILTAVSRDEDDHIFPIAYAVVEVENKETWIWFLELLLNDIGSVEEHGWTFMSDRQKGLIEALVAIVPKADIRICSRHLWTNFKQKWPGENFKADMWAACRAYTLWDFNVAMEGVKAMDHKAYNWLLKANPILLSRHVFPSRTKCDMLLNNCCESFNHVLQVARDKPILTLMETIRRILMKRFSNKKEDVMRFPGVWCPKAVRKLEVQREYTVKCKIFWDGQHKFEVDYKDRKHLVDLTARSCSCYIWDLTGVPCVHAIACLMDRRENPEDYLHNYYNKNMYILTYSKTISLMPGIEQWEDTPYPKPGPPPYRPQPGRPLKKRKREEGEKRAIGSTKYPRQKGGTITCSKCGQKGHNKKYCKSEGFVVQPSNNDQKSKKKAGRLKK